MTVSKDSQYLGVGSKKGVIRVVNIDKFSVVLVLSAFHTGKLQLDCKKKLIGLIMLDEITCMAFSDDMCHLITASMDRSFIIFDFPSGIMQKKFTDLHKGIEI